MLPPPPKAPSPKSGTPTHPSPAPVFSFSPAVPASPASPASPANNKSKKVKPSVPVTVVSSLLEPPATDINSPSTASISSPVGKGKKNNKPAEDNNPAAGAAAVVSLPKKDLDNILKVPLIVYSKI